MRQLDCRRGRCVVTSGHPESDHGGEATGSPFWVASAAVSDDLCKASDLSFSRDGKWLLFSVGVGSAQAFQIAEPWPSVGVVSSECLFRSADPRRCGATVLTSLSSASHLWLSASGRQLFTLDAGGRRVSRWPLKELVAGAPDISADFMIVEPAGPRPIKFPYDVYTPRAPVVQVLGFTMNENLPAETARLSLAVRESRKKAGEWSDLETVSIDQGGVVGAVFQDRRDGALLVWNAKEQGLIATGLRRPYWDDVVVSRGNQGPILGAWPMLLPSEGMEASHYWNRPARVIRSNVSGRSVGYFGETSFQSELSKDLAPDFGAGRRSLWAYSVDARNHRALAVVLSPFGKGELQLLSGGKMQRFSCLGFDQSPPERFAIKRSLLELGHGDFPLPARLYQSAQRSGRLIVWMHGGPDTAVAYETGLDQVAELVRFGYDVLVPEYSGTRGKDLSLATSLRDFGQRALKADIASIESWVRSEKYDSVTLYGISFGGLYSWMAAESDAFDRHILVAPLLKWRGEVVRPDEQDSEYMTGRAQFIEMNFKNVFGEMFSNGSRSLIPYMEKNRGACGYRKPFLVVVGQLDEKSNVDDLGDCRGSSLANVVVLPAKAHDSVGSSSLEIVKEYLSR